MDFEILFHLQQDIHCIVKGGMAVPFHIDDKKARRLSEDIDIVTNLYEKDFTPLIEKVGARISGIAKITACLKKPGIPKISYDVVYNSNYHTTDTLKLDVILEQDIDALDVVRIPVNSEVFAFIVDYEINVLSRGNLVGDKVTALASQTVGIRPDGIRTNEIAKQIYDIGLLLIGCDEQSFRILLRAFRGSCSFECKYRNLISEQIIAEDISRSMRQYLKLGKKGYLLIEGAENRYHNFKNTLLGSHSYSINEYKHDILLIELLLTYIQLFLKGQISESDCAHKAFCDKEELKLLSNRSPAEKNNYHRSTLRALPTGHLKNYLERTTAEQSFLHIKISENRKLLGYASS
jgi:hypothetical protein